MKKYFEKNRIDFIILSSFLIFVMLSKILNISAGLKIQDNFLHFSIEMIGFIPLLFILIGLLDVWFPREKVEKHIGKDSGIKGMLWAILFAMMQVGPLYGAFPVTYLLWKKGASTRNIFIYLGA